MAGSCAGTATACSTGCISRSTGRFASWRDATPAPPPLSWTARASRAPKKGAAHRPNRLRRGQEDQGQEAPPHRRHAGPVPPPVCETPVKTLRGESRGGKLVVPDGSGGLEPMPLDEPGCVVDLPKVEQHLPE